MNLNRQQLEISLGLLAALVTLGLFLFAGQAEEARMAGVEAAQRAGAIEAGADLYEIHCRSCHGPRGNGLGELGPPLNDEAFFTTRLAEVSWQGTLDDYVFATVSTGRLIATRPIYAGDGLVAAMTPWSDRYGGPLRDDQVRHLAVFVANWEATALGEVELEEIVIPTPSAADRVEAVTRGREVFLAGGCAGCHTVDGINQAEGGPDLSHIGTAAAERKPPMSAEDYIRESFLIPNAFYGEGYEPETVEARCDGVLTEGQLDDLVVFLLSLE